MKKSGLLFIALVVIFLNAGYILYTIPSGLFLRSFADDSSSSLFDVSSINNNETKQMEPPSISSGRCSRKSGILLIQQGDRNSATGTLFFVYVTNHIIYAEQNNLVPWIHLQPTPPCYDESVHGAQIQSFEMLTGIKEERIWGNGTTHCRYDKQTSFYPGRVIVDPGGLKMHAFELKGNGIWDTYFETTGILAGPSCKQLPLLVLDKRSVDPGMHFCAPWSVHAWPHVTRPYAFRPDGMNITVHEWFALMRYRAADVVKRFYHPLPWLQKRIDETHAKQASSSCLSIHIRMTDKGNYRVKKPLHLFKAYAEAYVNASGGMPLFVATDDATVLEAIKSDWKIKDLFYQKDCLRMNGGSVAVFYYHQNETHRTNTESLVDIYSMSKCDFFVHGYSAMAEATIYVNPDLHNRSVNLDVPSKELVTVDTFRERVKAYYHTES